MRAAGVVVPHPGGHARAQLAAGFVSMQVNALVFQGAPKPFDEHIVHPPPAPIHADAYPRTLQHPGEARAGELAPLIGIHNSGILPNTRALKSPFTTHITHAQANAQR